MNNGLQIYSEMKVLNFANQMKTLEKILSNQKQRGILGEIQLENLLSNVLPPELFSMQYSFSNGEQVDAIVKVGEYIIPIDAKFSLDNYNKMIECSNKNELEDLNKCCYDPSTSYMSSICYCPRDDEPAR